MFNFSFSSQFKHLNVLLCLNNIYGDIASIVKLLLLPIRWRRNHILYTYYLRIQDTIFCFPLSVNFVKNTDLCKRNISEILEQKYAIFWKLKVHDQRNG